MPETYSAQLPDGRVITKTFRDGVTDAEVQGAFLAEYQAAGFDRTGPVRRGMFGGNPTARAVNALTATPETLTTKGTDAIRNALSALGVDERYAHHVADRTFNALNDLTPVGDAVSFDDARQAFGRGDYLSAAGNALLGALGAVPGVGDAAAGLVKHAIIAPLFHGSPHKFDKFSLDKIGTGEGAQAYGHGLYFAENAQTAKTYRDAFKGRNDQWFVGNEPVAEEEVMARFGSDDRAVENIADGLRHGLTTKDWRKIVEGWGPKEASEDAKRAYIAALDVLDANRVKMKRGKGHLYEVQLDANPEDFLDWDAPLEGQRGKSADFLRSELSRYLGSAYERQIGNFTPKEAGELLSQTRGINATGPQLSQDALAAGIPGIRYLDQGSRGSGDGTRNYVVFDDSIIDILNRY